MIDEEAIQAKSDQMNAVDFANPVIFKVEKVDYFKGKDQPVHIHMEGYKGRPYKPSKGMLRGLMATQVWGNEESHWKGKLIELYNDPTVKWAGKEHGGIKISAVSGINKPYEFTIALSRNQRELHTFNVLDDNTEVKKEFIVTHYLDDINEAKSDEEISAIVSTVKSEYGASELEQIKEAVVTAREKLKK